MAWTGTHRAFTIESFLTNGEFVTATLNFRNYFQQNRYDLVFDQKLYCCGSKILELQAQHSSGNPLEDQIVFELQRTSNMLKNPFCDLQRVQLVSILLHCVFLFAVYFEY